MCAVVGLWSQGARAECLLSALTALQHRGQSGAGLLLAGGGKTCRLRKAGALAEQLAADLPRAMQVQQGLGHLRYATSGCDDVGAVQPLQPAPGGRPLALVHNGNLTQLERLSALAEGNGPWPSDSALLLELLAQQLVTDAGSPALLDSATDLLEQVEGGFACILWLPGQLLAFRDRLGIRPLQLGQRVTAEGIDWMLASESGALAAAGFELVRDLAPGEVLLIDASGSLHSRRMKGSGPLSPSSFEYVYFAAPEARLDGISVAQVRSSLGQRMAAQLREGGYPVADAWVVPVPSTSCLAARSLARALDRPYREWLRKRQGSGRSFIQPTAGARRALVEAKFVLDEAAVRGRHVLLVDDSIVRGTTLGYLVQRLRAAGAARITLCSTAPPVRFADCYGIDLPERAQLIAHGRSEAEVAALLGVDQLLYLPLETLLSVLRQQNPTIEHFECALFDGKYVAGFQNKREADRLLAASRPIVPPLRAIPA